MAADMMKESVIRVKRNTALKDFTGAVFFWEMAPLWEECTENTP